jgi:hypothetical protein
VRLMAAADDLDGAREVLWLVLWAVELEDRGIHVLDGHRAV